MPSDPLPDIRLEHFACLIARNTSKRGAVIQSFPLASPSSASFRASRMLQDDKVRDRITWLKRRICSATASEDPDPLHRAVFASDAPESTLGAKESTSDNLGHASDNLGQEKRRVQPSGDLTAPELRRIIADHARNGNASALNAAIKILDAQMSAPAQVADPAGLCAILFNGGGGGETLQHVVARLVSIFGLVEIRAEIDRITAQRQGAHEDIAELPNATLSMLCDVADQSLAGDGQGQEQGKAQCEPIAGALDGAAVARGVGGEGGESRAAEDV